MTHIAIMIVTLAILVVMSVRYDQRRRRVARLPMQWSLSGQVNWTAPRRLALAVTPVLAAIVLTVMTTSSLIAPRGGQDPLPILLLGSLLFVVAHALHLYLSDRTLDRAG
ncbi:hypothetical protein [Sphingomonas lacusdianchii]|uniref:hypothetical protein n=1 Tax=Sphingomonas lacusdianchii TaxID=2917992 RepID=UPI001F5A3FDA|nr:hypothetical protein [Sphingomonas sp. JXJ CY 53]